MVNFAPVALQWPLSLSASHPVPGERDVVMIHIVYFELYFELYVHSHAVPPHQKHLFHNHGDDYEPHSQKTKGLGQAALNCALDISSSLFGNASCVKGKSLEKNAKTTLNIAGTHF